MEDTNFLVPKHRKISKEEVKELMNKYKINSTEKLPKIKIKDPAIIELNAEIGDVIEITRNKDSEDESKYYRVVINK